MMCVKDVAIHLVLHEYRAELDLEFRWLNEVPEELVHKWNTYLKMKKHGD